METMEQRRDSIAELINTKGSVSFAQLKEAFPNVSEMTLRTDLKYLDGEKKIIRVHGGAKSIYQVVGTDGLIGVRAVMNTDAKQVIAEKAARLIHPGSTIFLDSGSTAAQLAKMIPDQGNIIYTTGLNCAVELARLGEAKVYVPGGAMNRYSLSVFGMSVIEELEKVNFDIAFMGVTKASLEAGFTCGSYEEAALKQAALRRSERRIILMDSSKINQKSIFSIAAINEVDTIISDGYLPEDFARECRLAGVEII
jgi:DeoR family transcriptional regulator of aga operon